MSRRSTSLVVEVAGHQPQRIPGHSEPPEKMCGPAPHPQPRSGKLGPSLRKVGMRAGHSAWALTGRLICGRPCFPPFALHGWEQHLRSSRVLGWCAARRVVSFSGFARRISFSGLDLCAADWIYTPPFSRYAIGVCVAAPGSSDWHNSSSAVALLYLHAFASAPLAIFRRRSLHFGTVAHISATLPFEYSEGDVKSVKLSYFLTQRSVHSCIRHHHMSRCRRGNSSK
ncbi:hypothetical protein C8R44DRAFT_768483 [Mycena epipterygia]|nr:hypothetical protein C8R44DRAFT_768483 [Mycena epipterygia]